jgi:hypothetical protein
MITKWRKEEWRCTEKWETVFQKTINNQLVVTMVTY